MRRREKYDPGVEAPVYKGNVVAAGPHLVRARNRERAWRKLHRRIARDVLNGDLTQATVVPAEYLTEARRLARRAWWRRWLMRHGLLLP